MDMAFPWRMAVPLVLLCVASPIAKPTYAQTAEAHAKIELIGGAASRAPEPPSWVGLLFQLDPGWHIYWENPGDSGEPPKVEWQLPSGYEAGPIRWPTPIRLGSGSVVDYGYEGEVALMAAVAGPRKTGLTSFPVAAEVRYIVCREICIPGKAHLTAEIPIGNATREMRERWKEIHSRMQDQIPQYAPAAWNVTAKQDEKQIVVSAKTETSASIVTFFPEQPAIVENSAPQAFAADKDGFRLTLQKSQQLQGPVHGLRGLLVFGPPGGSDHGPSHAVRIAIGVSPQ